jgi:hypothetical protein
MPVVLDSPIAVYDCAACRFWNKEVAILQFRLAHRPEQVRMLKALPFWLSWGRQATRRHSRHQYATTGLRRELLVDKI